MATKKNDRPIVDKDCRALVASAIASLSKVYGLTTAQAAARISKEADRVAWDIGTAVVLKEMAGTGLGTKPANDAATKPSVAKAAPQAEPVKPVAAASVRRRKAR